MNRSRSFLVAAVASVFIVSVLGFRKAPSAITAADSAGAVIPGVAMLEPRSGHSATLLPDGKVLIAGGMRRNQDFYSSAELFDPVTGRFQATGQMHVARVGQAAVLLRSGKVLVVGGWIGHGATDSAELYDPASRKFSLVSRMTAERGRPTATLLPNGDVLVAGGADHDAPGGIASAELFRADSLTFEALGSMHDARIGHTATLLDDGRVLVAGGRGESVNASAELYDPKTRQFTVTGPMVTARYKHIAGLLPDGRVLIAGGSDARDWRGTMSSAEIYDPHAGRFTATSPMSDSRFKLPDEAVRIGSGELLIAGGGKDVEVYNPGTGRFLLASGQLSDSWHFMSETRLKDGRILLAGGYADNDQATSQTWIYRP
ncbi:MAG TPA: kelch repeat-containing protein [Verrucomicrobiae bacterium]|nr:kelch repeat-containing protein [Verrucomicrobiae bacterium]